MIFEYFKKLLKLTSIIFTLVVLFQLIAGQHLDNTVLYELLALSLIFTSIKVLINKYMIPEDSIFNSLFYLIIVWLMVIASNYIFNWNMSISSIFLTFIEIPFIYIGVRIINYQHDKKEVQKMNEILNKNRKNKT